MGGVVERINVKLSSILILFRKAGIPWLYQGGFWEPGQWCSPLGRLVPVHSLFSPSSPVSLHFLSLLPLAAFPHFWTMKGLKNHMGITFIHSTKMPLALYEVLGIGKALKELTIGERKQKIVSTKTPRDKCHTYHNMAWEKNKEATAAAATTAAIWFPRVEEPRNSSQAVNAGNELWKASKSFPDGLGSMVGSFEVVGQHSKCTNQHGIGKVILRVLTERQAGKYMQQSQTPVQKYLYKTSTGSKVLWELLNFLHQWKCFKLYLPEKSKSRWSTETLLCVTHGTKGSMCINRGAMLWLKCILLFGVTDMACSLWGQELAFLLEVSFIMLSF